MKSFAQEALEDSVKNRMGWLRQEDVRLLSEDDELRLQPCLVRCGGCRFTAPAQNVNRIIDALMKDGEYVRDVCIPAGDPIWKKLGIRG